MTKIAFVLLMLFVHLSSYGVEGEQEQWQKDIAARAFMLRPQLIERHKDLDANVIDLLLGQLSVVDWQKPRQALEFFYKAQDSDVVALALQNPALRRRAAEYLQNIGTPAHLSDLCDVLLLQPDSPYIGSSNITEDIRAKKAIVKAISKITNLNFNQIDLTLRNEDDISRIADETLKWKTNYDDGDARAATPAPTVSGQGIQPAPTTNLIPLAQQSRRSNLESADKSVPVASSFSVIPVVALGLVFLGLVVYFLRKRAL
jgi:hypothetical protein